MRTEDFQNYGRIVMDMGPLRALENTKMSIVKNGVSGLFCIMEDHHFQRYPIEIFDSMAILEVMKSIRDKTTVMGSVIMVDPIYNDRGCEKFAYTMSDNFVDQGLLDYPLEAINYTSHIDQAMAIHGFVSDIVYHETEDDSLYMLSVRVKNRSIIVAIKKDAIDESMFSVIESYNAGKETWATVGGYGKIISSKGQHGIEEKMFVNNVHYCHLSTKDLQTKKDLQHDELSNSFKDFENIFSDI